MTPSTSAYKSVGGGPSAPQAREPPLFAPRHWPRGIASPWPRSGTRGQPRFGPAPHSTMLFSGLDCRSTSGSRG